MADRNINRTAHVTFTAGMVDRYLIIGGYCGAFQVWNRSSLGSADIYVRADGVDPLIGGDGSYLVPPNQTRLISAVDPQAPDIRLVCGLGTPYSVECV